MSSTSTPPGGGTFRTWLRFYKWGRPETVTFRTSSFRAERGDVLFFVLDGFLIGDASITRVRNDVVAFIEGCPTLVQELDVGADGIWEYLRTWGVWDRLLDKWRLRGLHDEVPTERALKWLHAYRSPGTPGTSRRAVYQEGVEPPFFKIKKSRLLS